MKKNNIFLTLILSVMIIFAIIFFRDDNKLKQFNNSSNNDEILDFSVIDKDNKQNVEIYKDKKVNKSNSLNESHYVNRIDDNDIVDEQLFLTDISLIGNFELDKTIFSASIVNDKKKDIDYLYCIIIFKDNDGNDLYAVQEVMENLLSKESRNFKWTIGDDFANAKDFVIRCKEGNT